MNIATHERTARIQQLSRYLCMAFTALSYLLWLGWPLLVFTAMPDSNAQLAQARDGAFTKAHFYNTHLAIVACQSVILAVVQILVKHLRHLLQHFTKGDIFNVSAIAAAKKALHYAIALFCLGLVNDFAMQFYNAMGTVRQVFRVDTTPFLNGLLFFGLMYVLVWALEIGRDLNEESVLTV